MSIKFLVLGGGLGLGGGGWEVPILFYGREDFSDELGGDLNGEYGFFSVTSK